MVSSFAPRRSRQLLLARTWPLVLFAASTTFAQTPARTQKSSPPTATAAPAAPTAAPTGAALKPTKAAPGKPAASTERTPAAVAPMAPTSTATTTPEQPVAPVPPGHPPMAAPGMDNPHGAEAERDVSQPDPTLPAGTLTVEVVDENDKPVAGAKLDLGITFESIAKGPQESSKTATTDQDGRAVFSGLSTELRYSYQVTTTRGPAHYGVPAFRLTPESGHRVRLHTYPSTHDVAGAFVGMRGFVYVRTREDIFQVEMLFRVMNMGRVSWVPQNLVLELPKGFTALDGPIDSGDTRFIEAEGRGAQLTGTFGPGTHDVRMSFQVPSDQEKSQTFPIAIPPHVAELRVLGEAAPGMTLDVKGFEETDRGGTREVTFEEPQVARGPAGDRVLITRRLMRPGENQLKKVLVELGGLPVAGPARWIAVALALAIALGGIASVVLRPGPKGKKRHAIAGEDLDRARKLLLDELVAVERAFDQGDIGPVTREQARRRLLDALARLDFAPRASGSLPAATKAA